tara:strand:+ start:1272 stop:2543 length:1272 start_codon:yes stop_codon:yes gene_type:complete
MKNMYLNMLSLINVSLGFVFILALGQKLGLGAQTDIYFFALVFITYLETFVNITWFAIKHYYAELKIKDKKSLNNIYVILLNNIILSSLTIVFFYFIVTSYFEFMPLKYKAFLDVFIYYLVIKSLMTYSKNILNLEHNYASVYLVDIFVYSVNLLAVIFLIEDSVLMLAYTTIASTSLVVIWQLKKIFDLNNFKYKLVFYEKNIFREIFTSSLKLNFGAILYNSKDIAIATIFAGFTSGTYSLYSYANKFVGVIAAVVTGPIEVVYNAKISHTIAKKEFKKAAKNLLETLSLTSTLFFLSGLATYFIMPIILEFMLGNSISGNDIDIIQYLFMLLAVYNFLKVIELPYKKVLNLFKFFNFSIYINIIYFFIVVVGYVLSELGNLNYTYILFFIIIAQSVKVCLSLYKYRNSMYKNYIVSGANK